MTLGDRIAIFNAGRIEQVGAPMALYERPCNQFVAGFLGSPRMNFLPVALAHGLGHALPGGTVTVGLRPEQLRWVAGDDAGGGSAGRLGSGAGLAARVERIEHLGDVALVHCHVDGADEPVIVKSALAPRDLPAPQAVLWLQANAERVLCFDAQGRLIVR